jgi:hypothetical protein
MAWPEGRYFIELEGTYDDGTAYARWLGAQVIRLSAMGGPASPVPQSP